MVSCTCVAPEPVSRITRFLAAPARPDRDLEALSPEAWEELAVTAIALGLAPLLHWRLSQAGVSPPPLVMARLAVTRQAHERRNSDVAGQLGEILAGCASEKIDVVVLKGALLAAMAYPEAGLRPMNDIDLLFRPPDLDRAGRLLERLGYEGKHKSAGTGPGITKHLSTYRRPGPKAATPNPYLSTGGERTVEPHGSLEEAWFGLKVDITPGVWERVVPVSLNGQPAFRLSTPDTLLHLAVHAAFHVIMASTVFVQLYDVGQVMATWPAEMDWNRLASLARTARAEPFVYAGLSWAGKVYGAPIPVESLAALRQNCPPGLAAYIDGLDAAGLLGRTQQPPLVSLRQRLWRGLQDRREAARWAGSPAHKWRVWQTALAFHKTDTARLFREKLAGARPKVER